MEYIKRIDWQRVTRTVIQVFGGVFIAFMFDFGADGEVVIRDYIFGQSGLIVVGTAALAMWMNLPVSRPEA